MQKTITTSNTQEQFSLAPQNFEQLTAFADLVSKSGMVPKDYVAKPGNVIVAVQMGVEIGLKPMQSIQNISVINGRPSVWGDALLALVKVSGVCEYIVEEIDEAGRFAICKTKRKGEKEQVRKFTYEDAKAAGLLGKDIWRKYLKRMLQMRARAWLLRDVYPDVLGGLQIAEEQEDKEFNQQQNVDNAPKSLEQLGLKTIEKDGFLVVQGNTHGKTDLLKQFGFQFSSSEKNWKLGIPNTESTNTEKPIEAEVVENEEPIKEDVMEIENPVINTLDDLDMYIESLGFKIETKNASGKTYAKIIGEDEEILKHKRNLNSIGFRFTQKGVVANITDLENTDVDKTDDSIHTNDCEVQDNDCQVSTATPFDIVEQTEIVAANPQNDDVSYEEPTDGLFNNELPFN